VTKLPVVSAKKLVAALAALGYETDHQTGSHIILRHHDPPHRRLSIPNHREIARGTLKSVMRQAGITLDQLLEIL